MDWIDPLIRALFSFPSSFGRRCRAATDEGVNVWHNRNEWIGYRSPHPPAGHLPQYSWIPTSLEYISHRHPYSYVIYISSDGTQGNSFSLDSTMFVLVRSVEFCLEKNLKRLITWHVVSSYSLSHLGKQVGLVELIMGTP